MNKRNWALVGSAGLGVGLGAGLMYLLDPQGGGRRRALARDKAVHVLKKGGRTVRKTSRHLGNRARGLAAEAGSRLRRTEVDAGNVTALHGQGRSATPQWSNKLGAALGAAGLGLLARGFKNRNGGDRHTQGVAGFEGKLNRDLQTAL